MTDLVSDARPTTDTAADAAAELNGAVVLRPRRRRSGDDATGGARVPSSAAELRHRVSRLHRATELELERRRTGAGLEPAGGLPVDVGALSSISRELPRLAARAPRAVGATAAAVRDGRVREVVGGLARFAATQRDLARRRARGELAIDDFGFDREWTESLLPFFRFLYRDWWRVRTVGLEKVPSSGRALLVSNHAGVLPYDGAMIRTALVEDHPARRHARALILNAFFGVPVASWFLRRTGNTLAHPDDAERLLERDELVLVFPEGAKGTGKPYGERYRLRRFGRGGFVQIAMRTRSPIIPVSVVGSEEIHPMLANVTPLAGAMGMPYFPLTPTFPLLGPLGVLPMPSSWVIEFHDPIEVDGYEVGAEADAGLVMRLADEVRDVIQAGLYRNLERRGSVFA